MLTEFQAIGEDAAKFAAFVNAHATSIRDVDPGVPRALVISSARKCCFSSSLSMGLTLGSRLTVIRRHLAIYSCRTEVSLNENNAR